MSSSPPTPSTIRAWQYTTGSGGLENTLQLNTVPLPQPKPNQHLVQILTAALNPVDHKPAETPLLSRLLIPKPATPGIDFAGRIVKAAAGSHLKEGQLVFGGASTSPFAAGALREYAVTEQTGTVAIPAGLAPADVATIGVGGLTAYQSLFPHVKKGDRVFINGGSGGTGTFAIQLAKIAGCHVTTSCSTPNVALCRSLGADVVIDYKKQDVLTALAQDPTHRIDHVVDNVGSDMQLYWQAPSYTTPKARFIAVGHDLSLSTFLAVTRIRLWPKMLGGGQRRYVSIFAQPHDDELVQIAAWMKDGRVRPVVDQRFAFEEVREAFARLKTGRARGKVVVDVADA